MHWVAKSQARLSDFTFTFHFHALEKEMTTLGLALGSPIFPSGCEGKLGVTLESLQGRRRAELLSSETSSKAYKHGARTGLGPALLDSAKSQGWAVMKIFWQLLNV